MLLADKKFEILKLKGVWNAYSHSEENILSIQAEIQNLNKRTVSRDHNGIYYKPNKTQGKYSREKPTWMNKNIKPKGSEPKISTWDDTAWNWCSK